MVLYHKLAFTILGISSLVGVQAGFKIPVSSRTEELNELFGDNDMFFQALLNFHGDYGSSMTRPPTPNPTRRPTRIPATSRPPTPNPTRRPTRIPATSRPPTPNPTRRPTRIPATSKPTMREQCLVDLSIECVEIDGIGRDCYRIPTPSGKCNREIRSLSFTYIGGRCSQSANTQVNSCEDFRGGPFETSRIVCANEEGEAVFSDIVSVDETFVIPRKEPLSDALTCQIFHGGRDLRQTVQIDTSGNEDIYLKDIYGSLQLESCNNKNCLVPVEYTYTIENILTRPMAVTALERNIFKRRMINGESKGGTETNNLIGLVEDRFLEPGESTEAKEESIIDVCVEGEYATDVVVKADPLLGIPCEATDEYEIITVAKGCRVDVDITCEDEEGKDCNDIGASLYCNDGRVIGELTFSYLGGRCDQSSNSQNDECEDLNGGPNRRRDVRIICHSGDADDDTTLLFFNSIVSVGQLFSITNESSNIPLPREVVCEIIDPRDNEKKQCVTIATRGGGEELYLKDVLGSLRVEGCDSNNCFVPITYTYTLENVGQTPMTITKFELSRGDSTENLLDDINDKTLEFGETRILQDEEVIDVCVEDEVLTIVSIEADPPEGVPCTDVEEYVVETGPEKDCRVDVDIICEDEDENDCNEIPVPSSFNCILNGCVDDTLSFTYTAKPCSNDSQNESCVDVDTGIFISSYIECSDEDNRSLFEGTVSIGDMVDLQRINSRSGNVICQLFSSRRGDKFQEVQINVCEDLFLKNEYGSLRLESCDEMNCIVPIQYTYTLENLGSVRTQITEFMRIRNDQDSIDLIDVFEDTNLSVGETSIAVETDELDVCLEGEYSTKVLVKANPPEGITPCNDEDIYEIISSVRPTSPPTRPPTRPPTLTPGTPPPTRPPTPLPTLELDVPSPSPSQFPSIAAEQCFISVDAECTPSGQSQDCGSVVVTRTRCENRPLAMVFRYNGGTCAQSDNIQNAELFQCTDLQGGPPTEAGEISFITATDIKGGSIVYHADRVAVGSEYTISDQPFEVEPNINVTIWSSPRTLPQDILQTLVFHSSCSQNLFLKDRFGASQLVVFVNEEQGLQSCYFNATFTVNIANEIRGTGATLQRLSSATNYGLFNLTREINGLVVEPGETVTPAPSFDIVIDLTVVTNNEVLTIITAESAFGNICSDSDFFSFVTGLARPPNVPTRVPTSFPTRTPLPTPDPEVTSCSLQAVVTCDVQNGGGLLDCENIAPPTRQECLTGGFPRELEFIYRGGNCQESNTTQTFLCNGNADRNEVWITIISANQNILWNRITPRDTFMDLRGIDESMTVEISTIVNGRVGQRLQFMEIRTTCDATSALRLKDTFGALQLAEFTTVNNADVAVANAAFANVVVTYSMQLESGTSIRARAVRAVSTGGLLTDPEDIIYPVSGELIEPRDTFVLGEQGMIVDLTETSGDEIFRYRLEVNATSASNSDLACGSVDNIQFGV